MQMTTTWDALGPNFGAETQQKGSHFVCDESRMLSSALPGFAGLEHCDCGRVEFDAVRALLIAATLVTVVKHGLD